MDEKHLKEISNKLTVVIKLLMSMSETYQSNKAEPLLKLLDGVGFSNQEIADLGGIAVKTIANVKSKIKKGSNKKINEGGKDVR